MVKFSCMLVLSLSTFNAFAMDDAAILEQGRKLALLPILIVYHLLRVPIAN